MKTYQNSKSWGKSSKCSQLTGQKTTTARFIHGRFYGNESFHFPSILRRSPLSPTLFIAFFFHRGHERSSSRKSFWLPWKKHVKRLDDRQIADTRLTARASFSPGFRKAHWICNGLNTPLTKVKYATFYIVIHHFYVIFRFSLFPTFWKFKIKKTES